MRRLALLLPLVLAQPLAAGAEERAAAFSIEWAGFQVGTVDLRLHADEAAYRLSWRGRSIGWFGALFPFEAEGTAVGQADGMEYRPTQFAGRSSWRDGERRWRVEFAPNGRAAVVEVPAEDLTEREPVPHELQIGPDPASLALTAIRRASPGLRLSARSFDGRRAFGFALACAEASGAAPASELACSISTELLAGASLRWREGSRDDGARHPLTVWLQRGDDGQLWPARLEASSRFGTIAAQAVSPEKLPAAQ
ncbi:MAG: DUF3108 domain-containing protein [Geminicoccaceae bacterium]